VRLLVGFVIGSDECILLGFDENFALGFDEDFTEGVPKDLEEGTFGGCRRFRARLARWSCHYVPAMDRYSVPWKD
jgi:hypothetical protein